MMKIAVIGASGNAGQAIFKEATKRGHEVTGIVRHAEKAKSILGAEAHIVEHDAFTLTKEDLVAYDTVVDAFNAPIKQAYLHIDLATHLIHELRETTQPRVIFITGAASLTHPDGGLLYDHLIKLPGHEAWIATPENQYAELEFLRHVTNVNWLAVSPSQTFEAGDATAYVRGEDTLLFDAQGQSVLSSGNLALLILDEIEAPQAHQQRITARNQ